MSFILDALKKSESDRQRQSGPSLFEVKVAPPRRTLPVWAMAIAVLLAINVVVISWMLLRHASAQRRAAPGPAPVGAPAAQTAAASQAAPRPLSAAASSAQAPGPALAPGSASAPPPVAAATPAGAPAYGPPPVATTGPQTAAGRAPAAAGADTAPGGGSSVAATAADEAPAVLPAAAAGSEAPSGGLPLYPQIVATDGLPPLHLDLHVYAQNPHDRFVMINMHKLVEGDSLPNGVHVDAIRPDGAVLSYHGTRFLLPRD
jgi:general secretion pathway protein B